MAAKVQAKKTVKRRRERKNIEKGAAHICSTYNNTIVTSKDTEYIMPITKGIKLEHPEFKLEEKTEKDEITGEENVVIYYTMPDMNQERHDVCTEYIKVQYDATSTKLEAIFSQGSAKIALKMNGASEENIKLAKDKLQEIYDWHTNTLKKLKEDKEKEVEDAFQAYLAGEQEENKASEEKQAAEGIDSVFSMNMDDLAK